MNCALKIDNFLVSLYKNFACALIQMVQFVWLPDQLLLFIPEFPFLFMTKLDLCGTISRGRCYSLPVFFLGPKVVV